MPTRRLLDPPLSEPSQYMSSFITDRNAINPAEARLTATFPASLPPTVSRSGGGGGGGGGRHATPSAARVRYTTVQGGGGGGVGGAAPVIDFQHR